MSQHEYDTEVETADGDVEITIVYTFREGTAPYSGSVPEDEVELDEVVVQGKHGPETAPFEIYKLVKLDFDRWYDQLCEHARGP